MGKVKKGFNWKARQNESEYQKQTPAKVNLDIDVQQDKYDENNVFALPSKKQKAKKIKQASIPQQKPLSKKQKKELKKVIKKRLVGQTRKQLYEDLAKVQASDKELSLMTSVSEAQTIGVKRLTSDSVKGVSASKIARTKINSIKGSNTLRAKKKKGAVVIPVNESSSSVSSDNEENNEFTSFASTSNTLPEEKCSDISAIMSSDASFADHTVKALNSTTEIEPVENENSIVEPEMDVDINECEKKTKRSKVGSLKKKKIKRKSTMQLDLSKEEVEMENHPEKKETKEEIEMEKQPEKKETKEEEMNVDLDEWQNKCDESNTVVCSVQKKKIKRKSLTQLNVSKQEVKIEKQHKPKEAKTKKKKQIIENLEEGESTKEESDMTIFPSKVNTEETQSLESNPPTPSVPAKHVPVLRTQKTEMKLANWMDMEQSLHSRGKPSWEFTALLKMIRLEQAERQAIRKDIDTIFHFLKTACPSCINKEKQEFILKYLETGCSTCAVRQNQDMILHSIGTAVLKHAETKTTISYNMTKNYKKQQTWNHQKQTSHNNKGWWKCMKQQTPSSKKNQRLSL